MAGGLGHSGAAVQRSFRPLPAMRQRRLILWALLAATIGLVLVLTAPRADAYVNPFSQGSWSPGRIDMGVDMIPNHREPIRAIGAAKILGSTSHSGWPGGRYLWYQLLSGSHKGEIVYVAEHLRKLAPEGRRVKAGQRVATALPGSPWIETGWATEFGSTRAAPCYKEGQATHSGKTFARFLYRVGMPHVLDVNAGGSAHPTGRLC
jgi:murein DD-endopeptidase MepM/ murein hydrolase activator NlpD